MKLNILVGTMTSTPRTTSPRQSRWMGAISWGIQVDTSPNYLGRLQRRLAGEGHGAGGDYRSQRRP